MAAPFDPYAQWLGITSPERPVNHYVLLGLPLYCDDAAQIQAQTYERSAAVRQYQLGIHSALSQRLLNEIATACICLSSPDKKRAYDDALEGIPVATFASAATVAKPAAAPAPTESWNDLLPAQPAAKPHPALPSNAEQEGIPKPILAGLIILPAIVFTGILLHVVVSHLLSGEQPNGQPNHAPTAKVVPAPVPPPFNPPPPRNFGPPIPPGGNSPPVPFGQPVPFGPPVAFGPPAGTPSRTPKTLVAPFDAGQARDAQAEWAGVLNTTAMTMNSIGMNLIVIPPGEFEMGSPADEEDRGGNEQLHHVRITRVFFISMHEVTQGQFEKVMGFNPSHYAHDGMVRDAVAGQRADQLPVESVFWRDAKEFCDLLSRRPEEIKARRSYRLPTEAEWEYVCRAGTTSRFYTGDRITGAQANIHERASAGPIRFTDGPFVGHTLPVGCYPANSFGVCDMHGNVAEWVNDFFEPGEGYYAHSPMNDPPGPAAGDRHVVRGLQRSAQRIWAETNARFETIGFRVVAISPTPF